MKALSTWSLNKVSVHIIFGFFVWVYEFDVTLVLHIHAFTNDINDNNKKTSHIINFY